MEKLLSIQNRIEQYYKEEKKTLSSKIAKRIFDPQDLEDVLQEAFTRALTFKASFREDGNFNAWFGIILNNCVKDYRREFLYNQAGVSHTDSEELDEDNFDTQTRELDLDWIAIKTALKNIGILAPSEQEIIRLYHIFGYKPKEIKSLTDGYSMSEINNLIKRFKLI